MSTNPMLPQRQLLELLMFLLCAQINAATAPAPPQRDGAMEQSFSADGGKSWEVNWICDLSR
jgi:hypothetical protein